ncbi:hypothetical protein D3C76_732270 [compost metagenome]
MVAAWVAEADAATARGKRPVGTMFGSSAWVVGISNERAVPRRKARTKIISRVTLSLLLPITSARAIRPWPTWQIDATRRRS